MAEIVINLLETICLYELFIHVLPWEKEDKRKQVAGAVVIVAVVSVMGDLNVDTTVKKVILLFVHILYADRCFRGSTFEKILWGCTFMPLVAVSDQITFFTAGMMERWSLGQLLTPGPARYEMVVIYLISCACLTGFLIQLKKIRLSLSALYETVFVLIVAGALIILDTLLDLVIGISHIAEYRYAVYLIHGTCFLLFAVFIYMIHSMAVIEQIYRERNELQDQRRWEESREEEIGVLKNNLQVLRGWRHDIGGYLDVIQSMADQGEFERAKDYAARLHREMRAEAWFVDSGNAVIDAVVSSRKNKAAGLHIRFENQICLEWNPDLTELDLSRILMNVLDNAIEAAAQVEDGEQYVLVKIETKGQTLCISVKNSYDGILLKENGRIISRKKSENHGIGLGQIDKTVEKYNGYTRHEADKKEYRVLIVIPQRKEEIKR